MNYKIVDDLSSSVAIICALKVRLVNMLSGSIKKNRKITQHIVHTNFLTLDIYLFPLIDLFD